MNVAFDSHVGQVSALRSSQRVRTEEKTANTGGQAQDQFEISAEGRQAVESLGLNSMTLDDFVAKAREQLGKQELEVNWNATVDPDGQIWARAYCESYVSQLMELKETAENAIRDYYSDAYQEVLDSSPGAPLPDLLNFVSAKYLCSWSDFFDGSMPANQRLWTHRQLCAMLTGTSFGLNDPYALKGIHIPTSEEISEIARNAANDKISELVRQAKETSGITEQ